jgi:hypothetical protein
MAVDPLTAGMLIGGGAQMIGGLFGNASAKSESARNRRFQERMSNTAHQRQVKDLQKAGLNPLLSATGGASSPSGSMASQSNIAENVLDTATAVSSRSLQKQMQKGQLDNLNKDTLLKGEQAETQRLQQLETTARTEQTEKATEILEKERKYWEAIKMSDHANKLLGNISNFLPTPKTQPKPDNNPQGWKPQRRINSK